MYASSRDSCQHAPGGSTTRRGAAQRAQCRWPFLLRMNVTSAKEADVHVPFAGQTTTPLSDRSGGKRMESTGRKGETRAQPAREKRVLRGRASAGRPTLLRLTGGRFAEMGLGWDRSRGSRRSVTRRTESDRERREKRAFPRGSAGSCHLRKHCDDSARIKPHVLFYLFFWQNWQELCGVFLVTSMLGLFN